MTIHPTRTAQIAFFLAKKVTVLGKYLDLANVFLEELANVLSEQIRANKNAIKLKKGKQSFYEPIYSLKPVKLKILKIYIKINLINGLIIASNLPTSTPILFVCKQNGSFRFCKNYQRLNNLTITNWYLLSLIEEFLDWLGWAKQFTPLNLTSAYH